MDLLPSLPADEATPRREAPRCGDLPLRQVSLEARLDGLVAWVVLRQVFANDGDQPIEATYIFPLPDRAAVTGFWLRVGDRQSRGVLRERAAAREAYAEATAQGQRAALAEEERPDVFTVTAGNVRAGDRVTVQLELLVPLSCADGEALFRFPLLVAPRYSPGTPLPEKPLGPGTAADTDRAPDASRVSPPRLAPGASPSVDFSCSLWLEPADLDARELRASLPFQQERLPEGGLRLRLAPGEPMDRDLLLRFRVGSESLGSSLLVAPGEGGGHFALTLVPPARHPDDPTPRDVVFVLDRSGSMEGWKMTVARRATEALVGALRPIDRFDVLAFDDLIEAPPLDRDGLLAPATERNQHRATRFLSQVGARNGTEMAAPLRQALEAVTRTPGRRGLVVFLTDGQVTNEDELLAHLADLLPRATLYAIGIDQAVAAGFLRRLATLGGGWFEQVEDSERLHGVMDSILARLRAVVADQLSVDVPGLVPGSLAPARLPALYAGLPLVVLGRYQGDAPTAAQVHARPAHGEPIALRVRARTVEPTAIRALWARARLRDLEDALGSGTPLDPGRTGGATYEEAIVATSLEGGVLSRLTAFVAVDPEKTSSSGESIHIVQPVASPAGWSSAARSLGLGGAARRQTQTRAGSLKAISRYLTPEQARGMPSGRTTPVFQLGLLLHEMLLGEPYIDAGSDLERLMKLIQASPDVAGLGPRIARAQTAASEAVSQALAQIVATALQPIPTRRFADADAMRAALQPLAPPASEASAVRAAFVRSREPARLAAWETRLEEARRGQGSHRVGPYLLIEELEQTAEAVVWLAAAPAADGAHEPVELQLLHAHQLEDPDFAAEVAATARVLHPSVVELRELVHAGDELALVFSTEAHVPLTSLLRPGPLPLAVALSVACALADAVDACVRATSPGGATRTITLPAVESWLVRLSADGDCRLLVTTGTPSVADRAPVRNFPAPQTAPAPPRAAPLPTPTPAAGRPAVSAPAPSLPSGSAEPASPAQAPPPAPGPSSPVRAWLRRVLGRGP